MASPLAPMRIDLRPEPWIVVGGLRRTVLTRGLLVLVALALPALALQSAGTTVRHPEAGAMQTAAVRRPPPAWTAAVFMPVR